MNSAYPPIAELVPHAGRMLLLDRVLADAPDQLTTELQIRSDAMFCDGYRVPGWIGIEYMAQSIAALDGWEARQRGEPVRVGLLLGARDYQSHVPEFPVGACLQISVRRAYSGADGFAAMDCQIHLSQQLAAQATLVVYQPDQLNQLLPVEAS